MDGFDVTIIKMTEKTIMLVYSLRFIDTINNFIISFLNLLVTVTPNYMKTTIFINMVIILL